MAPGEEPAGSAFDAADGLLFCGCGNGKLAVLDVTSWQVVTTLDIGEGCDGCAFDPASKLLVASCRGGGSSAFRVGDHHAVQALGSFDAGKTCDLDPTTQRAVAIWVARRACGVAGLTDLDWVKPAFAAVESGESLPFDLREAFRLLRPIPACVLRPSRPTTASSRTFLSNTWPFRHCGPPRPATR